MAVATPMFLRPISHERFELADAAQGVVADQSLAAVAAQQVGIAAKVVEVGQHAGGAAGQGVHIAPAVFSPVHTEPLVRIKSIRRFWVCTRQARGRRCTAGPWAGKGKSK